MYYCLIGASSGYISDTFYAGNTAQVWDVFSFEKIYLDPSLISSPVGSIVDGGNVLLGGNTISGRAQPNQQQEKPKK